MRDELLEYDHLEDCGCAECAADREECDLDEDEDCGCADCRAEADWEAEAEMADAALAGHQCVACGCTDAYPCDPPCVWASPTCCSRCA